MSEKINEARLKGETKEAKRKRQAAELPTEIRVNPHNLEVAQIVNGANIMVNTINRLKDTISKQSENIPESEFRSIKYDIDWLQQFLNQLNNNADLIHAVFEYVEDLAKEKEMKLPIKRHYAYDRYVDRLNEARLRKQIKQRPKLNGPNYLEIHDKISLWRIRNVIVGDAETIEEAIESFFIGDYTEEHEEFLYDTILELDPDDNQPTMFIKDENNVDNKVTVWDNIRRFNVRTEINEARLKKPFKKYPVIVKAKFEDENIWLSEPEHILDVLDSDEEVVLILYDEKTKTTEFCFASDLIDKKVKIGDRFYIIGDGGVESINGPIIEFNSGDRVKIIDEILYESYDKKRPWVFDRYVNNNLVIIRHDEGSKVVIKPIDVKYIKKNDE